MFASMFLNSTCDQLLLLWLLASASFCSALGSWWKWIMKISYVNYLLFLTKILFPWLISALYPVSLVSIYLSIYFTQIARQSDLFVIRAGTLPSLLLRAAPLCHFTTMKTFHASRSEKLVSKFWKYARNVENLGRETNIFFFWLWG